MKTITMDLSLFEDTPRSREEACRMLLLSLGQLVEFNRADIRAGKSFAARTTCDLVGDDVTAVWACAKLRESGIAAKLYLEWQKRTDGGMTCRLKVSMPDGTVAE